MQGGDLARQPPVGLFGERRVKIAGPQAGLDMDHGDLFVECCERSGESRGRVALHDDSVGTVLLEGRAEALQDPRGQAVERLAGPDDV
jgi:hypothetical protein